MSAPEPPRGPVAASSASSGQPTRLGRWLREPVVQFLLVGSVLFAGHQALGGGARASAPASRIELTEDDLRQMTVAWLAQGRPTPTPEQMRSLVENKIREEILYREALALGLDKDDTIVKRRMAQKMEFLFEDVSAIHEPPREELQAWFVQNASRFMQSPRVSFRHLYFSPDRRGTRARDDAARALERLGGKPANAPGAAALADPFMFQDFYADSSFEQLAKLFGPQFAQAVLDQKPGAWRGPIESGYGWHLVWIDSLTPGRVPALEEIEPDVKAEWMAEQRSVSRRRAYDAMRARYQVVLPEAPSVNAAAPGKKAP